MSPPPSAADDAAPRDSDYPSLPPMAASGPSRRSLAISIALFCLTFASTTFVGSLSSAEIGPWFVTGLTYSVPLMAILLAHELGHYIAARIHRVPASLPFFMPVPIPPLGTMGAVILMPGRIARRDALFDNGAAGPLAGLAVALPVLIYGLAHSAVGAPPHGDYLMEGHSLLYTALLRLVKGPIPPGQDIQLTPTAFAGWAGLLVTMINLLPALQLDGGHVAYALFGERQETFSRWLRRALLPLALLVSLSYGVPAYLAGTRGDALQSAFAPGAQWFMWWLILRLMARRGRREHPKTDDGPLSPRRRIIAVATLLLFPLLFMPVWLRLLSNP
jgi:membrane-associated protease RseP (regulator of RpoE activity)